jgi:hypothetical protein
LLRGVGELRLRLRLRLRLINGNKTDGTKRVDDEERLVVNSPYHRFPDCSFYPHRILSHHSL